MTHQRVMTVDQNPGVELDGRPSYIRNFATTTYENMVSRRGDFPHVVRTSVPVNKFRAGEGLRVDAPLGTVITSTRVRLSGGMVRDGKYSMETSDYFNVVVYPDSAVASLPARFDYVLDEAESVLLEAWLEPNDAMAAPGDMIHWSFTSSGTDMDSVMVTLHREVNAWLRKYDARLVGISPMLSSEGDAVQHVTMTVVASRNA